MVNLDYALHEADFGAVLREGGQVARALVLALEGLRNGPSQPDDADLELLLDLALDTRLLWGRASELHGGADNKANGRAVDPVGGPGTPGSAKIIPLRSKVREDEEGHGTEPDGSTR